MFRLCRRGVIVFLFAALVLSGKLQAARVARPGIRGSLWQPAKLVPGSPVLFQIPASKDIQEMSAHWFGHEVTFFRPGDARGWYALAAVPIEAAPGSYDFVVSEKLASGKSVEVRKTIRIA